MPPSASPPSIAQLAVRGAIWTGAGQYLFFAFGIAKAIILARAIDRELFGLVAGATVWASYLGAGRLDLRMAALGSREEPEVLDTQFLLENLTAALAFPLTAALMLIWPQLVPPHGWILIFVMLGAAQFDALSSTSVYLIEKRLRQDIAGRFAMIAATTGFVLPVAFALAGHPLVALGVDAVWSLLLTRAGAVLYIRWRPRGAWTLDQARQQLRLAGRMWIIGVLGKITLQFDDWLVFNVRRPAGVIWRGAGVEPEALYDRAYSVSKLPMDLAGGVIASNALAIYAERASHGGELLLSAYRRMTWSLAWVVFSSGAYLFLAIDDLVYVLGDAWLPMVPLLRLMILFIVGRPLLQNCAHVLLALQRERDVRFATGVQAAFLLVACPPAVYSFGAAGAAVVVSIMSALGVILFERCVTRRLGRASWPMYVAPACTAVATIAAMTALETALPASVWLSAIIKAIVCGVAFGSVIWVFDRAAALDAWRAFRRGWSPVLR